MKLSMSWYLKFVKEILLLLEELWTWGGNTIAIGYVQGYYRANDDNNFGNASLQLFAIKIENITYSSM